MLIIKFNDGWFFKKLNSNMPKTKVVLPHDAMLLENRSNKS